MSTDGERAEEQVVGSAEGTEVVGSSEPQPAEQVAAEAAPAEEELDLKGAIKVLLSDNEKMKKFMESFDVPAEEDTTLPVEQAPVQPVQPVQQQPMQQMPLGATFIMTPYGPQMIAQPGQGVDLAEQQEPPSPEQMRIQQMEMQLKQMKMAQIKTQVESMRRNTTRYPDFRRAETVMAGLLTTHPSMADDLESLYKAAGGRLVEPKRPEQVRQAVRAAAAATKPRVAPVASVGKKSFDQTLDETYDRVMGGG